jgi:hypothetical protein
VAVCTRLAHHHYREELEALKPVYYAISGILSTNKLVRLSAGAPVRPAMERFVLSRYRRRRESKHLRELVVQLSTLVAKYTMAEKRSGFEVPTSTPLQVGGVIE